jgi:uncharacterized UPF0160 family protein
MKHLITHNGTFHADDVFAFGILSSIYPEAELIRTRSPEWTVPGDGRIIFDLGADYDAEQAVFDHHQPGRAGTRENGIPYAACGLIWKHYGRVMICDVALENGLFLSSEFVDAVWMAIDQGLISAIDIHDNGEASYSLATLRGESSVGVVVPHVSQVIDCFNLRGSLIPEDQDFAFKAASKVAIVMLTSEIRKALAEKEAEDFFLKNYDGGPVMVLPRPMNWYASACRRDNLLFVVYPEGNPIRWRVKATTPSVDSFESRKLLPEAWWGLRDQEMQAATGVESATFCHPTGFTGGAIDMDGAYRLALLATGVAPAVV